MVINRVQTLYLIAAIVLMVVFLFVPFGRETFSAAGMEVIDSVALTALSVVGVMVTALAAIALTVVAVFFFKKLSVQKLLTQLAMLATIGAIVAEVVALMHTPVSADPMFACETQWSVGCVLPFAALLALAGARKGISHDQRLLSSADRLR